MGTFAALATVAALALGGGSHAPAARPVEFGTEASNKALAEKQASEELRSLPVPPRTQRVEGPPTFVLVEPLGVSGDPREIDRRKWLVAPTSETEVFRWFVAHPPPESHVELESSGKRGLRTIWFVVPVHSVRVGGLSVIESVARLPRHKVGIQIEIRQDWKLPHPTAAKVPAAARFLEVSRRIGRGRPTFQLIRSPRRVRRIAHAIDTLPANQPVETYFNPCEGLGVPGERRPRRVEVRMKFRAHKAGPLLAEATMSMPERWCEPFSLRLPGAGPGSLFEAGGRVVEMLRR
jgi:hypothetical protein